MYRTERRKNKINQVHTDCSFPLWREDLQSQPLGGKFALPSAGPFYQAISLICFGQNDIQL